ncbi:sporulation-delaying protein SdpB family protein [Weizmannia sp. CD-2023]|uniref:sporulation-delaying protein SdpB family protein n=2 Tax=Heyndrickxia TaxID=2837504 RepID=UPI002E20B1AA
MITKNFYSSGLLVPADYFYLNVAKWIAIIILLITASGWRPRITGILHWWIAFSLQTSAVTLDGGEQVAQVLTFLMIPITLTDPRKWHWESIKKYDHSIKALHARVVALVCFGCIRFQVSIIYFHAAVAKYFREEWIDGTALYYYLSDPMLGLPNFIKKFADPILTSPLVAFFTWGTTVLELFLFLGLFAKDKWKKPLLISGFILHGLIAIMLGLISFAIIMFAALILYLRPFDKEYKFGKGKFKFSSNNEATMIEKQGA